MLALRGLAKSLVAPLVAVINRTNWTRGGEDGIAAVKGGRKVTEKGKVASVVAATKNSGRSRVS